MLRLGIILGNRYRTFQILGMGGMGTVYLAEDQRLTGRMVAIKENLPAPNISSQTLALLHEQFQSEARILAHLNHPNLPKVFDYFSEGGRQYLVMEYVEGETLEQMLSKQPSPYEESVVLKWALQLCDVLFYLHHQTPPIIFRDLKPSNIMLTPHGELKLIDFGIARFFRQGQKQDTITIGTPNYAPLEQYGSSQTDARSDIYSLGATLYYLLTKVEPIQAAQRVLMPQSLQLPCQLNASLSPQIERVLLKAMAFYPHERYQTTQEMKQALLSTKALLPSKRTPLILLPSTNTASSISQQIQRFLLFIILFLVTLLIGVGVGGWYFSSSPSPTPTITIQLTKEGVTLNPTKASPTFTSIAIAQSTSQTTLSSPTIQPASKTKTQSASKESSTTVTPRTTLTPSPIMFFDEQFEGAALDNSRWNYANRAGQMSLEEGILRLAAFGPQYPYLHSQNNPFPATGNFQWLTSFRYPEVKDCGVGILITSSVVPPGLNLDETGKFQQKEEQNGVTIGVWQDQANGLQLWFRAGEERFDRQLKTEADTVWHKMKIDYIEAKYMIYLDNELIYHSSETTHRANVIWMGHPANLGSDCFWDTFEVDWIQIWQLSH